MAEGRLQDRAGGALVREGGQVTCEEAQEKWWFNADDDDNGDHLHAWSDVGGGKSDNGDEEHNDFAANSEVKKKKKIENLSDSSFVKSYLFWELPICQLIWFPWTPFEISPRKKHFSVFTL